ncbi:N-acetylneuraminate lyase-like [Brevipalpus obovatus]|uniref:N-acetylneuraminate lyase-like n=1 Tax=Brevipalpus obovatus TaxID=246614 RepID=UPI003D9FB14E
MSLVARIDRILQFDKAMVAPVTPFKTDGTVDHSMIAPYACYLSRIGVGGVFVHGTTGEGLSLTSEEKKKLTKTWLEEIRSKYTDWLCVFNVSATCVTETIEQANYYEELGVDAIAVLPPLYYRPLNDEQLLKYLKSVANAAPSTPLIYYHTPIKTNVNFRLKEFAARAKEELPQLIGMKYASFDMLELVRFCTIRDPRSLKIFAASEQSLMPMMALGVESAICSLFNFEIVVKGFTEMQKNFPHNMDEVLRIQKELVAFGEEMRRGSVIHNIKRELNRLKPSNYPSFKVGDARMPIME